MLYSKTVSAGALQHYAMNGQPEPNTTSQQIPPQPQQRAPVVPMQRSQPQGAPIPPQQRQPPQGGTGSNRLQPQNGYVPLFSITQNTPCKKSPAFRIIFNILNYLLLYQKRLKPIYNKVKDQ